MSNYQLTTSSELMKNYLQADVLLPQDKFIALQTNNGTSLLFSIGTGGVFYVTSETPGITQGWAQADLSSAQIKQDFPNGGATCKNFSAAQSVSGQVVGIHLAMVINDGTNDYLYLSLSNSDSDTSWTTNPAWVGSRFNAKDAAGQPITAPAPFEIAGVFLSEATDKEYIVVDVVENPTAPDALIERFYMDVSTPTAPVWVPQDLSSDIEAASYLSCLGRSAHAFGVDGLYTAGKIATAAQLIYTPLYNAFDKTQPPPVSRLQLPGGVIAEAIAACRNADSSSDLYAISGSDLYYFASTNQTDQTTGVLLLSNALLSGVRSLFASAADGYVTVWGLGGSDEVFYVTCAQAQVGTGSAWSQPISILSGVDAISPYIDRAYSANTFFAHYSGTLVKAVKTPATGLWNKRNITLSPSSVKQDPIEISSYTTTITVKNADGTAAAGVTVALTATAVTSVYINHLYYVIGTDPIDVVTDSLGLVTIVETVQTLAGTRFTATIDAGPQAINPMDAPFQRSSKLNSVSALQGAQITNPIDGTTRPFIPAGTSQDDLQAVALSNQNLSTVYTSVSNSTAPTQRMAKTAPSAFAAATFSDGIETDLGDLFSWLESGIESIISIVEDVAEGVWHFVAKIAGQVYHGILDCVEKVVAAALWVYNAIKVIIDDIIAFLEFLFAWPDILVTHRVMKNVLIQFAQYGIDGMTTLKGDMVSMFQQMQAYIDAWAGIPGFDQTPSNTANSNPPLDGQNSAPSNLGVHHFQGNCSNSQSGLNPPSPSEAIFDDLMNLLSAEEDTLMGAYNAVKTDIIDQYSSLSVTEIIKRFVAIVADSLLQSAENILVTALDVFIQLTSGMIELLTESLDIPVLSWLYKKVSGDDLSFLDVGCLLAAIPATLIYKATTGSTPFPQGDDFTNGLLNATSFSDVQSLFYTSSATENRMLIADATADAATDATPVLDQKKLKVFGFVTGVAALAGSVVLTIVSVVQKLVDTEPPPTPFNYILATIACVGNIAYVSPNIATLIDVGTDTWYGQVNNAVTIVSIVKSIVWIPLAMTTNSTLQTIFPALETLINIVWNIPVIANIVVNKDDWNSSYKSLIPETIGNFSFNIGGMMELPISQTKDIKAKMILAAVQGGFMLGYGVFMVIAGGIYEWAPNQQH